MQNLANAASMALIKKANPNLISGGEMKSKIGNMINIDIVHQKSAEFKNMTEFWFKPNEDIIIFRVTVKTGLFKDEVAGYEKLVFEKDQWHQLAGYENVKNGQKWQFIISGLYIEKDIRFTKVCKYTI